MSAYPSIDTGMLPAELVVHAESRMATEPLAPIEVLGAALVIDPAPNRRSLGPTVWAANGRFFKMPVGIRKVS